MFCDRQASRFFSRGLGRVANHPYSIGPSCCHPTAKNPAPPDGLHWHFLKIRLAFPADCPPAGALLHTRAHTIMVSKVSREASSALLGPAWPGRGRGGPRLAAKGTSRRPRHPACGCMMPPSLPDCARCQVLISITGRRLDAGQPDIARGVVAGQFGVCLHRSATFTLSQFWSVRARLVCLSLLAAWQWTVLAGTTCCAHARGKPINKTVLIQTTEIAGLPM